MFGLLTLLDLKTELKKFERRLMSTIEEKLKEVTDALGPIAASIEGVSGDLIRYADKAAADAAEIERLKQAVKDAQSNPGELSPELSAQFDAVIGSLKKNSEDLKALDEKLPEVPEVNTNGATE